jgi:hypothetical protein
MHWMIVHYGCPKANKFISADHILGEVHQLPKGFRQQYYYIVLKYFIHGFQVYHSISPEQTANFSQYSPIRGIVLSAVHDLIK